MAERESNLLDSTYKKMKSLRFDMKKINDLDTKDALAINKQKLVIGSALFAIDAILAKYRNHLRYDGEGTADSVMRNSDSGM